MRPFAAPLVLLLLAAGPSRAQVEGPSRVALTWENDVLAGTDRHYTNGLRVELSGRLDPHVLPEWLASGETAWGLALGQRIYTPERLDVAGLATDDRPYAGWSYVALSVTRRVAAFGWEDRLELSLGVVGPASGARATHELAHELFGSESPQGWRHQLRNEPTITLDYRASARLARWDTGGLACDVRPTLGVSLGNVATFASIGSTARVGLGVPTDSASVPPSPLRVYVTASAEVRLVGFDVFLDGSLLRRGGHRVEKERIVADLSIGLVVAIHDRVSLTYVHTLRTPEFEGQVGGDQFGSITMVFAW